MSENEDSGPRLFGESRFSRDFASFPDPAWIIDRVAIWNLAGMWTVSGWGYGM